MTAPPLVEILLATYNGQPHLGELLASLDAQTHTHWRLIARDDGSDDRTTEILDDFATDHGDDENEKVRIIRDDRTGLGARGNFAELLTHAAAPYVMFCDQDDVWLPTKVETTLAAMIDAEAGRDPAAPVLVHTDLRVVDASLQPVCESLWAYQRFDPVKANRFARTVVQNVVTGCTVMINAALADLARPIPPEAIMHDWWLALVAAAFGTIAHVDQPTILYRQHGANDTGAKRWSLRYIAARARSFSRPGGLADRLRAAQRQAAVFVDRHSDSLAPAHLAAATAYATIADQGFFARRRRLLRHGLLMHGRPTMSLIKNLGLMLRI